MVALDRKVVILEWLLDPTAAVSECRKSAQWGHKTRQGSADSSLLKTNRGTDTPGKFGLLKSLQTVQWCNGNIKPNQEGVMVKQ